jgi:hypothetical protein
LTDTRKRSSAGLKAKSVIGVFNSREVSRKPGAPGAALLTSALGANKKTTDSQVFLSKSNFLHPSLRSDMTALAA